MKNPKRATINLSLLFAGLALAGCLIMAFLGEAGLLPDIGAGIGVATVVVLGLVAIGGIALVHAQQELNTHYDDLERLRGDVVMIGGSGANMPKRWTDGSRSDDELARLAGTVGDFVGRQRAIAALPDRRLEAIVGTVADGLVVISETGLVTLINAAAAVLLDAQRAAVGTSVYSSLNRGDVTGAVAKARRAGRPVSVAIRMVNGVSLATRVAILADHGGVALSFPASVVELDGGLDHNLGLLDRLPSAPAPTEDTALIDLPAAALDCETTGLNVATDRIVSIGAVRLHGNRVFHGVNIDRLINPGMTIPARSTAVHGITNRMVAVAPTFRDAWPEIVEVIDGRVIVGHNIRFDLAMMARETERAGIDWQRPVSLDTSLLICALEPSTTEINLDSLANRFGVQIQGRHTALGDSLVTADIFTRMVPRLQDLGIVTLGQALAFQTRARHLVAQQDEAGW